MSGVFGEEDSGMPGYVESRRDLVIHPVVDEFLALTREEDPRLFKNLSALDEEGTRNLAGVLGRFDEKRNGQLDAEARLLARRVLGRIRKPSTSSLALLNRVLDYLDLNGNALLEEKEVGLFGEVCTVFQGAESKNESLSNRELELLYGCLRGLDRDHDGRLSRAELVALVSRRDERR